MKKPVVQASWVLIATLALSVLYEFYRATAKAGVSDQDDMGVFLTALPVYILGFALAVVLRRGWPWMVWLVLVLSVAMIGISIFYYSPTVLPARLPGAVDWFEDKVYTGLFFVVAALLINHLVETKLARR